MTLALIAHDGKKADMVAWATFNRDTLARYRLVATAATAKLLREKVGLEVEAVQPGPQGGDAQIGARVVEGTATAVIFLSAETSAFAAVRVGGSGGANRWRNRRAVDADVWDGSNVMHSEKDAL